MSSIALALCSRHSYDSFRHPPFLGSSGSLTRCASRGVCGDSEGGNTGWVGGWPGFCRPRGTRRQECSRALSRVKSQRLEFRAVEAPHHGRFMVTDLTSLAIDWDENLAHFAMCPCWSEAVPESYCLRWVTSDDLTSFSAVLGPLLGDCCLVIVGPKQ